MSPGIGAPYPLPQRASHSGQIEQALAREMTIEQERPKLVRLLLYRSQGIAIERPFAASIADQVWQAVSKCGSGHGPILPALDPKPAWYAQGALDDGLAEQRKPRRGNGVARITIDVGEAGENGMNVVPLSGQHAARFREPGV